MLLLTLVAAWLFGKHTALSFLGGGILGWVNFRIMVWLFRRLIDGGQAAAWYALPLAGKFGLLLAVVLTAGLWLRADILALAVGFSAIVSVIVVVSSVHYLHNAQKS